MKVSAEVFSLFIRGYAVVFGFGFVGQGHPEL
jgi:hypothetical protein